MHEQRGFCNKKSKGFLWDSIEIFVTLFDRLAVVSWGNFQFPRKILQLQITMLKQIGGFFHIIKKSPITSLEIGANWVKNAHIPIFPQTILKKGQKLLGKYIEIRKIPQ